MRSFARIKNSLKEKDVCDVKQKEKTIFMGPFLSLCSLVGAKMAKYHYLTKYLAISHCLGNI